MSINIHILPSSKNLKPFEAKIKSITKNTELLVKKLIPIGDIDVVFYYNPGATSKKNGIGGSSPCANVILIPLDPKNPKFQKSLKKELPYTLAHEINHAIRFRAPIPRGTLLEIMISEGLADHFAMEITKRKNPPAWSIALTDKQKKSLFKKASKEWSLLRSHHYAWFYGSKIKKIPCWTAYTLGYDLVAAYLHKHPDTSVSKLTSTKASLFISS